jgi:tetratricopeptide (TPR) repeat protein
MRKLIVIPVILLTSIILTSCDITFAPWAYLKAKGKVEESNLKLGIYFLNKGNIDKAIEVFESTASLYPNYAPTYFYLAMAYKKKGRPEEALLEYYKKAMQLDPTMYEASTNLGLIYLHQKKYSNSELCFQKAIKAKPNFLLAYLNLSTLYLDWDKYNKSEDILKKALEINPKNPFTLYSLGLTYEKMNRFEDAIAYLQKAIENSKEPELTKTAESIIAKLKATKTK